MKVDAKRLEEIEARLKAVAPGEPWRPQVILGWFSQDVPDLIADLRESRTEAELKDNAARGYRDLHQMAEADLAKAKTALEALVPYAERMAEDVGRSIATDERVLAGIDSAGLSQEEIPTSRDLHARISGLRMASAKLTADLDLVRAVFTPVTASIWTCLTCGVQLRAEPGDAANVRRVDDGHRESCVGAKGEKLRATPAALSWTVDALKDRVVKAEKAAKRLRGAYRHGGGYATACNLLAQLEDEAAERCRKLIAGLEAL